MLLEEGILRRFLKAGADPSALIGGSGPVSRPCEDRAAASVYLELCFDVLNPSPQIQALYLDVLSDFLQLSDDELLDIVTEDFCTVSHNKDKKELHWTLPFLAKVSKVLRLSLDARGPETTESLQSLDHMCEQVFPVNMYRPVDVATEPKRMKRKQNGSCHRLRKHKRQT